MSVSMFAHPWARIAHELGLDFAEPGGMHTAQIVGVFRGHLVEVVESLASGEPAKQRPRMLLYDNDVPGWTRGADRVHTALTLTLQAAPPCGLRLGREHLGTRILGKLGMEDVQLGDAALDDALRVSVTPGCEGMVRAMCATPELRDALHVFVDPHTQAELGEKRLRLRRKSAVYVGLEHWLNDAVQLAEAIAWSPTAAWAPHLAPSALAHVRNPKEGPVRLQGVVDGVPVEVRQRLADGGGIPVTQVCAKVPGGLPPGTRIARVEDVPKRASRIKTHHPILDQRLACRSGEPEALRARLAQDGVDGALLAFLCPHPGNRVARQTIAWNAQGLPEPAQVMAWVADVVQLARLLQAPGTG